MINVQADRREQIELFADYHQFYVQDGGVNPPAPEDWSDQDVENRAKVSENVIVVCPIRNMTVPVKVALLAAEPELELGVPDHVVECGISIPTGHFQVHECTGGPVVDWNIAPGNYQVRVIYSGLGKISDDGLEGEDEYEVQLWPGALRPITVVKQWKA